MAENGIMGQELAGMIDHTMLNPDATGREILKLCEEAMEHGFATVCVNGAWVALAAGAVAGTGVGVAAVAAFPLGAGTSLAKAFEAEDAARNGATEVDMVINLGALKAGDDHTVEADIRGVVDAVKGRARVKAIIEAALLTDTEKVRACERAQAAGAAFVKTSTGFGPGGATVEDVALMRRTVGRDMGVKAAGGIRTREQALEMIRAGANRLGTSASIRIVRGD
jgi:deoxyribose-phosphate aldolase